MNELIVLGKKVNQNLKIVKELKFETKNYKL